MWKTANEIFERSHQDEEGRSGRKKEQNTRETVNRTTTNECGKEEPCQHRVYRKEGSEQGKSDWTKIASVRIGGGGYPFGNETRGKRVHNKSKIKIGNRGKDRVSVFFFCAGKPTVVLLERQTTADENKYKFMVNVGVKIEN